VFSEDREKLRLELRLQDTDVIIGDVDDEDVILSGTTNNMSCNVMCSDE